MFFSETLFLGLNGKRLEVKERRRIHEDFGKHNHGAVRIGSDLILQRQMFLTCCGETTMFWRWTTKSTFWILRPVCSYLSWRWLYNNPMTNIASLPRMDLKSTEAFKLPVWSELKWWSRWQWLLSLTLLSTHIYQHESQFLSTIVWKQFMQGIMCKDYKSTAVPIRCTF